MNEEILKPYYNKRHVYLWATFYEEAAAFGVEFRSKDNAWLTAHPEYGKKTGSGGRTKSKPEDLKLKCSRGHMLTVTFNLTPGSIRRGERICRACDSAMGWARNRRKRGFTVTKEEIQVLSNNKFKQFKQAQNIINDNKK